MKSIEKGPSAKTYYLLGGIYFVEAEREKSLSKYKKAEEYLLSVLKINPRLSRAAVLLAKTYLALGDKEKARMHAQSALRNADSEDVVNEARSILQMK